MGTGRGAAGRFCAEAYGRHFRRKRGLSNLFPRRVDRRTRTKTEKRTGTELRPGHDCTGVHNRYLDAGCFGFWHILVAGKH